MTKLALFGAGGKMGVRLSRNLASSDFAVSYVEVSEVGRKRLQEEVGVQCTESDVALKDAEVVILAVPDTVIGKLAHSIVEQLNPGTMVVCLDAAAPFAGHLPEREDLTYFITHPCHPPIFNDESTPEARHDHFGGLHAKQAVVNSLMQGPQSAYELGDKISKTIYAPVSKTFQITVDQMALLEPGLSETICASLLYVMRQAMDEVISRGVPAEAAREFLLGHMNILGAVIFDELEAQFSDACNKAIEFGIPTLMRDDWKRVFEPEEIAASINRIT